MGQDIAHEVHPATLPGGVQDFGNRRLEPLMRIRDHQLDAAQAAPGQRAQKLDPEGLGLGGADRHAQHLAPAVAHRTNRAKPESHIARKPAAPRQLPH